MSRGPSRMPLIPSMLWLCATAIGCTDTFARQLVVHPTGLGRMRQDLRGSAERLLSQGRIDAHHRIRADDGIELDVWTIRATGTCRGTVILFHGICDAKASYLVIGEELGRRGFDVVLHDLRAHGRSGGQYVTWGALEQRDARRIMDELIAAGTVRPPVYAMGMSLGGAVAIQYAAIEPRCRGVMALAPCKDARTICRRLLLATAPLMWPGQYTKVLARAGEIGGFDPADASAVDAAARLTCPLLLAHGSRDWTVPPSHSRAIYDAAGGPRQRIVVPDTGHNDLIRVHWRWAVEAFDHMARTGLETPAREP